MNAKDSPGLPGQGADPNGESGELDGARPFRIVMDEPHAAISAEEREAHMKTFEE